MNADAPRNHSGQGSQLVRTTDYARMVLRRAQLALAVLAVSVSVTVGLVVAGTVPPGPAASGSALRAGASHAELLPAAPGTVAALARAEAITDDVALEQRTGHGVLAGMITLAGCWILLAAAGTVWRRRLAEQDLRNWADGWARVEPLWSDRRR
jgi:hypothetical protein